MDRFKANRNTQYSPIQQNGAPLQDSIPLEAQEAPGAQNAGVQRYEDAPHVPGIQASYTSATTRLKRNSGGGRGVIIASVAIIVIPMVGLAALLLVLVLFNNVHRQEEQSSNSTILGQQPKLGSDGYYVDFNPTTLVTIASWSSTVAPLLAVCSMVLVSFPLARSFRIKSQSASTDLPTSFQLSLLLDSFSGGITPLWTAMQYNRWSQKEQRMASGVRNALITLTVFTFLGYTIAGVDTWLHLVMKAVNIELVKPQTPQQDLGRGLPVGPCSNQSLADFDAGDCIINSAATNIFLEGASEAARVLSNTSAVNAVYNMNVGNNHYAYLGPATMPPTLDYRTSSMAVHTHCSQIGKKCNLRTNSGASEPFKCNDALYGDLAALEVNGETRTGRTTGVVFYDDAGLTKIANGSAKDSDGFGTDAFLIRPSNPQHFAVWAYLSVEATDQQVAGGDVVIPMHGGTTWLLNCSATAYTVTYDFVNGSVTNPSSVLANGSLSTIVNAPMFYGFGNVALETAANTATQNNDTARIAESFAQSYSQTAMSLSAGIMTSRRNLQEQVRTPKLVSKVPKAPLYTLVFLNTLYAVLGLILAFLALRSDPSEINELRQKLTTAGLVAAYLEPERAARPVDGSREMFAEYEGSSAGKVGVDESIDQGGYVLRLRNPDKGLP